MSIRFLGFFRFLKCEFENPFPDDKRPAAVQSQPAAGKRTGGGFVFPGGGKSVKGGGLQKRFLRNQSDKFAAVNRKPFPRALGFDGFKKAFDAGLPEIEKVKRLAVIWHIPKSELNHGLA